jgi:hypothetical protein
MSVMSGVEQGNNHTAASVWVAVLLDLACLLVHNMHMKIQNDKKQPHIGTPYKANNHHSNMLLIE